jgi:Tol biopolymer transport system component
MLAACPGNAEIYVMGSDGSNPTRLTNNLGTDENPSFSPDCESIAFVNRSDVYKMSSDGSNIKRLTRNAAGDFAPAFSPDGKKIVFVSSRNCDLEVFRMNARDGSRQKKLTNNAVVDTQPDWGVATP